MSKHTGELGHWLERFLREHLSVQRNVSAATLSAYRDTFRLLLRYLWKSRPRRARVLPLATLTPETVLGFLQELEQQRGNGIRTRNARLAAIRSFVRYLLDWGGPELPSALARILGLPFKRCVQPLIGFLNQQEVQALLDAAPDTWTGRRNYLLVLLLYNTGARISEILALRVRDLDLTHGEIAVTGKGRKQRRLPLWRITRNRLRSWLKENALPPEAPVLPNRSGQPLTRAGAAHQLQALVQLAARRRPSLGKRRISPHTFRHSTAMAMLEVDVPTEVIALYLGHENPKTTHAYVEASLTIKRRVLAKVHSPRNPRRRFALADRDLRFLEGL